MIILLALLLSTANSTPAPKYCEEVAVELEWAVGAQLLSNREAQRILERCITYGYPEAGQALRQS